MTPMHVTRTELEETLETITTAFSHKSLPDGTSLSPEQVDCIRDSLQDAIEAYEELYQEIRDAELEVDYAELIRTLRHFRNIQMRLRVNKDRFQAQADRFYDALRTLYREDIGEVLRNTDLHANEQTRRKVNECARQLHVTTASFGVTDTPKDPLLEMKVAD